MSTQEQFVANQKTISDLAESIALWRQNGQAPSDAHTTEKEMHERLQFKLLEMEIQVQNIKIDTMTKVLALYKGQGAI